MNGEAVLQKRVSFPWFVSLKTDERNCFHCSIERTSHKKMMKAWTAGEIYGFHNNLTKGAWDGKLKDAPKLCRPDELF